MVGGTWSETDKQMPESAKSWLPNKTWCAVCELSQTFEVFKDFDVDFEEEIYEWKRLYDTDNPHERNFPGRVASHINEYQRVSSQHVSPQDINRCLPSSSCWFAYCSRISSSSVYNVS